MLRVYAITAILGWVGGIGAFALSLALSGDVYPVVFVAIAYSAPVIPLFIYRGSGILGPAFEKILPGSRKPVHLLIGLVLTSLLSAGFLFGAWACRQESVGRERIRGFAARARKNAVVTCDGSSMARGDELLGLLATLGTVPPHASHPGRRFPVVIRSGVDVLELDIGSCPDSCGNA
jgi:hypothetical protein